ncbi:MAG: phospholipase D-like domain-containing protein [Phycicoccus sp.]
MSECRSREAVERLALLINATEAALLADRLAPGAPAALAVRRVAPDRRAAVIATLEAITPDLRRPVLWAIAATLDRASTVDPWFTAPGSGVGSGHLNSTVPDLVLRARSTVVCSTYNLQPTSALWAVLAEVAARPETTVRLYVDGTAAAGSSVEFAHQHRRAQVFRTGSQVGRLVRNHAKFLSIDARWILVTSANFSWSAENRNLELGVLHDDPDLAQTVERQWRAMEPTYFARVSPSRRGGAPPHQN